ncbi:MAG: ABC transporter permease subunit, partial [Thermodesulfobacteriota bacterium]
MTALLLVVAGVSLAVAGVGRIPLPEPLPEDKYGNLIMDRASSKAGLSPVVFSHWRHRVYFTCRVCHTDLGFVMKNGASEITGGAQGLQIRVLGNAPELFQFEDRRVYYFIAMALWLAVVTIAYRLRRSRLGYQALALRDDEAAAARAGIHGVRVKLIVFALSAALTAAAGTFYAQFFLFIDPGSTLGLNLSIRIILMAVL